MGTQERHADLDGTVRWMVDGRLHRTDGPAIEWANGSFSWFLRGRRHRVGGPAVDTPSGHREWHVDGRLHRTDGPAVVRPRGDGSWYLHGHRVTEAEFTVLAALPDETRLLAVELHRNGQTAVAAAAAARRLT